MEKKTPSPFKSWLLIGLVGVTFLMLFRMDRNPVSSTVLIGLKDCIDKGIITPGKQVMIAGFGVGLSWGGTILRF